MPMLLMLLTTCLVLLATVIPAGQAVTTARCPGVDVPGARYVQVFQGKCYTFHTYQRDYYDQASTACRAEGGTLALVKTEQINAMILTHLRDQLDFHGYVWIGLNDRKSDSKFVWEDGTTPSYKPFDPWTGLKPNPIFYVNKFYADCVALNARTGKWEECRCEQYFKLFGRPLLQYGQGKKRAFVCQIPFSEITTTTTTTTTTSTTPTTTTTSTTTTTPTTTTVISTTRKPTTSFTTTTHQTTPSSKGQRSTTTFSAGGESRYQCPTMSGQPGSPKVKVFGNTCYVFHTERKEFFFRARAVCQSHGGSLVLVKNQATNDFIHNHLHQTLDYRGEAWIGLTDYKQDGHFVWEDGSTMGYQHFRPDPWAWPHAGCAVLSAETGSWAERQCRPVSQVESLVNPSRQENRLAFVCQIPALLVVVARSTRTPTTSAASTDRTPSLATTTTTTSTTILSASKTTSATATTTVKPTTTATPMTNTTTPITTTTKDTMTTTPSVSPTKSIMTTTTPTTTTTTTTPKVTTIKVVATTTNSRTTPSTPTTTTAIKKTTAPNPTSTTSPATTTTSATKVTTTLSTVIATTLTTSTAPATPATTETTTVAPPPPSSTIPTTTKTMIPTTRTPLSTKPTTHTPPTHPSATQKPTTPLPPSTVRPTSISSTTQSSTKQSSTTQSSTTQSSTTQSSTTQSSTTQSSTTQKKIKCPNFICEKDCGMLGYARDENNCVMCECQDET